MKLKKKCKVEMATQLSCNTSCEEIPCASGVSEMRGLESEYEGFTKLLNLRSGIWILKNNLTKNVRGKLSSHMPTAVGCKVGCLWHDTNIHPHIHTHQEIHDIYADSTVILNKDDTMPLTERYLKTFINTNSNILWNFLLW